MKLKIRYGLLLVILLLLTACNKNEKDADMESLNTMIYVPKDIVFTTDQQLVHGSCVIGDTVYLLGRMSGGSRGYQVQQVSFLGGDAENLPEYQSALSSDGNLEGRGTIRAGADGTLWVMEEMTLYSFNGQKYAAEYVHVLRNLDTDGRELSRFEYTGLEDRLGMGSISDLLMDGEGDVFAIAEDALALLDETGEPVFKIERGSWPDDKVILLGDGRVGMVQISPKSVGESAHSVSVIDKEAKKLGETFQVISGTSKGVSFNDGDKNALFYYQIGDTLCAWRQDAEEGEQLLNLLDVSVESAVFSPVSLLDDGSVFIVSRVNGYHPIILTPTDASMMPDKKVLTLASVFLADSIREAVVEFNKTNPNYQIAVTDYSQYGSQEAAMTRLVTEIGAGKMPDILDLYTVPVINWANSGVFEDLWPYIDGDPELSRDALMEKVFQASEIDGKLYEISGNFYIETLIGAKSIVGDRMAWTTDDFKQALESMPEGCLPVAESRTSLLKKLLRLGLSQFVDRETGVCDFTGESFKELLRFCAEFPDKIDASMNDIMVGCRDDEIMLFNREIYNFHFPQMTKQIFGDDISYIGYPNDWNVAGSSFSLYSPVAMSSSCKDKEGAWEFLRTFLLPKEQEENSFYITEFPINRSDFEKRAERLMIQEYLTYSDGGYILDDHDEKIPTSRHMESYGDLFFTYYAVTREEYDQLMALYNSIDTCSRVEPDLEAIIVETAGAYFAGDKSLDMTVELIQNRASLYINEQS